MNRAQRRAMRHAERRDGCTCRPDVEQVPSLFVTAVFTHERGCPLGDSALALNARGIIPGKFVPAPTRCAR